MERKKREKNKKPNLGGMQIDTQGRLEGNQHFPHFPKFQSTLHGQFGPKVAWQLPLTSMHVTTLIEQQMAQMNVNSRVAH